MGRAPFCSLAGDAALASVARFNEPRGALSDAPPQQIPARGLWTVFWGLVAANVVLVWLLPVLPQQDLPQHLAYARILRDHSVAGLPFAEMYRPVEGFQLYFTSYHLLRWLSFGASIEVGARMMMSLYAVGMFGAFAFVIRTVGRGPNWAVLLAVVFIWNPLVVMGFLANYAGLPFVLTAVGATLGWIDRRHRAMPWVAGGSAIACALFHPVLGATVAGCLVSLAVLHPHRADARRALLPAALALVVVGVGLVVGRSGLGDAASLDFTNAWRRSFGVDFVSLLLKLEWSGTTNTLNYVLWSWFGPFPLPIVAMVGLFALTIAVPAAGAIRACAPADRLTPAQRALLRVALLLFVVGWLAPFGIHAPTELTFINLRLITIALMLGACAIPAVAIGQRWLQIAAVAASIAFVGHLAYRLYRSADQATALFGLLDRVEGNRVLMSLMINNESPHLSKQFRTPHFLPMYYSVRYDGIATQFWARYTHHLPVDYAPGKRPRQTDDWTPNSFAVEHLADSDYLVVREPSPRRDPEARLRTAARIRKRLEGVTREVGRDGPWVLYRVDREAVRARQVSTPRVGTNSSAGN